MDVRVSSDGSYRILINQTGRDPALYVVLGSQPLVRVVKGNWAYLSGNGREVFACVSESRRRETKEDALGKYTVIHEDIKDVVLNGETGEVLWEVPYEATRQGYPALKGSPFLGYDATELLMVPDKSPLFFPRFRYVKWRGTDVSWRDVSVRGFDSDDWRSRGLFVGWHWGWTPDGAFLTKFEELHRF
ncbi:MAG: hypothetical protein K6T17_07010 [Fimbriimonadales bacterium]|nr:hypothetical protein [Fimbriimonadales bacterium]